MGPSASGSLDVAPAQTVGPYRLLGELGRGGMGVVYRAEDPRLGREVALKVLPAALARDGRAKERLLAEARAAARIDHPNVCTVYEVSETAEGRPYIALACYDGETLEDRLARGPLAVAEAVRVVRAVAAGVAAAHARGVVHRDLKPSNVFLCRDGTPKVLDFGIAKVPDVALTEPGQTAGTVAYAAPEQARGLADARSDVWALGAVLYEALTGRRPFVAPYEAAVLYAVLHHDPAPPGQTAPDVPPALDAAVARCLAKDSDERFPTAAALEAALADVLAERAPPVRPPSDRPPATGPPAAPASGPARRLWTAGALAALAVALAWVLWPGGTAGATHLAVLPFSVSPDTPDERAFAEGLAGELASGVAEVGAEGLWVVPASEVRAENVESAGEAARVLGVDRVVTGSLRREGGRLLLTLTLVDAESRRALDSEPLSFGQDEVGRVRGEAVLAVAEMLGLAVSTETDARLAAASADPEATEYYLRGLGYLERDRDAEDLDRAVDLFGQAVAEDPAFAQAHAGLGRAFLAKYGATRDSAFVGRARAAAERARALDGEDASVHVTLSELASATGEYPLAMRHARQALDADPDLLAAHLALAAAQEAASDVEGAEATLRRAAGLNPTAWTGPLHLGRFYFNHQRFGEAAPQFRRVVALVPNHYIGHLSLGGARQLAGDADGARAAYERVVALRPDHYATYLNLGTLLLGEGDYAGAAGRYRQALALDSTDHNTWRNLASAYFETGETARWRDALRGALRRALADLAVNPNEPLTLADVATYRQGLGDRAGAFDAARRAVALAPGDAGVQFGAALVFAGLGEVGDALDALAAAAKAGYDLDGVADDPAFAALPREQLARLPASR